MDSRFPADRLLTTDTSDKKGRIAFAIRPHWTIGPISGFGQVF